MNRANNGKTMNEAAPDRTLRDLLAPLFRHRKLAIAAFCTVFVAATLVAWVWAANYYVAKMQVVVEQDRTDPAITAGQSAAVAANKVTLDQVSSEVALLQGQDMLRAVITTCGLVSDDWSPMDVFLPSDPARRKLIKIEKATNTLSKSLKVESSANSDVIDVRYGRKGEPETPACVLQNLSKLYLEKHLQLHRPPGSSDFFAQEADKSQKALADSEARLAEFSKDNGVAAPEVLRTYMAQQVANSTAALYNAQQSIAADKERLKTLDAQLKSTPARSATMENSNAANLLLQQLEANLLAAQIKRTQLLVKYEPTYPLVQEADQEISQTQAAIAKAQESKYVNQTTDRDPTYEFLREDYAKTQVDLASQQATASALDNSIRNLRLQMVKLDQGAVEQSALLREAKANEATYLLYRSKHDQERTSDALDQKRIGNVAIAVPATTPVLPAHSPISIMFYGFIAAIFCGLAIAFVAEYLDPSFRTPADVMETLSIPVLASMPRRAA